VRRALVYSLALFFSLPAAPALADHVTASPQVSARLGERIGDNHWIVIVDWSVNCSGPPPGNDRYFGGSRNLDDLDSGEVIYMGGVTAASGSNRQPVTRRSLPRRLRPRIEAGCYDNGVGLHGSGLQQATGNTVTVPALGDDDGDGVPDGSSGAQGSKDFPGAGFGGPGDPLRSGGCDAVRLGTKRSDTLNGTAAADLISGLGGNDLIRGRGDDDCLIGSSGKDRLFGGPGYDRLTGGTGADALVGGSGVNRYDAGAGNDVVNARNGRAELVSCGSGRDRARVDRSDRVRNCERVKRSR
jgi:Ca2+-binding RTX toxin-like protein